MTAEINPQGGKIRANLLRTIGPWILVRRGRIADNRI